MPINPAIGRLPYAPDELGRVSLEGPAQVVAGSMATFRITYTAGRFGIDDQGGIRFLLRFASDAGRPQFDRPNAPNFCSVSSSNGSALVPEYHPRGSFRPWFKAIRVNVMRDALREGNTITLVLGDRSQGSAGWRVSTMREPRFEVRVQADPWGAVVYGDVAGEAVVELVAGAPHTWRFVMPTLRNVGQAFDLGLRCDDRCGNPVSALEGTLQLEADGAIEGLPERLSLDGRAAVRIRRPSRRPSRRRERARIRRSAAHCSANRTHWLCRRSRAGHVVG